MILRDNGNPIKIIGYHESTYTQGIAYFIDDVVRYHSDNPHQTVSIMTPEEFNELEDKNKYQYALAFNKDLPLRFDIAEMLKDYSAPAFIHYNSYIATMDVTIGQGVLIGPEVTVLPHVTLGDHIMIDPLSLISHDVTIGNHCFIRPGTIIAGRTTIGNRCVLGLRSTISDGLTIADDTIVGQMSGVTKTIEEPGGTYIGTPARRVRG